MPLDDLLHVGLHVLPNRFSRGAAVDRHRLVGDVHLHAVDELLVLGTIDRMEIPQGADAFGDLPHLLGDVRGFSHDLDAEERLALVFASDDAHRFDFLGQFRLAGRLVNADRSCQYGRAGGDLGSQDFAGQARLLAVHHVQRGLDLGLGAAEYHALLLVERAGHGPFASVVLVGPGVQLVGTVGARLVSTSLFHLVGEQFLVGVGKHDQHALLLANLAAVKGNSVEVLSRVHANQRAGAVEYWHDDFGDRAFLDELLVGLLDHDRRPYRVDVQVSHPFGVTRHRSRIQRGRLPQSRKTQQNRGRKSSNSHASPRLTKVTL